MTDFSITTNEQVTVTPQVADALGIVIPGVAVTYAISDATIATVTPSTDGLSAVVAGVAAGVAILTETVGAATSTDTVTVTEPVPTSITDSVSAPVAKA